MRTRTWQTNLFVRDIQASIKFYRLLELDFDDPFEWPEGSGALHVEIGDRRSGCYLALDNYPMAEIWRKGFEPNRGLGNVVVGLLVDTREDVDRLCTLATDAGHRVFQKPTTPFLGRATRSSSILTGTRWASRAPSKTTGATSQSEPQQPPRTTTPSPRTP